MLQSCFFFFSSRRRHTRCGRDWSSDVCSSDLISAVLLIAIWENQLHAVGMLHPEPAVAFDYHSLIELPFLRLDWPVVDGVLKTEWVIARPAPRVDRHIPLSLTNEELRGT